MKIADILQDAESKLRNADISSARLDSQLLLSFVIRQQRAWLLANGDQRISNTEQTTFTHLIDRRAAREPLAHLTGSREFYGLDFFINQDVLTPRAETEKITELAIKYAPQNSRLIDIGTGCGAIAIAIAKHRPDLDIWATEISPTAISVAKRNAKQHSVNIKFVQSDLFESIDAKFSTVVTNLPYLIDNTELMPEVQREPAVALFGGSGDGLELYRRFLSQLPNHLEPGGYLFTECDPWQQPDLIQAASDQKLTVLEEDYFVLGFKLI